MSTDASNSLLTTGFTVGADKYDIANLVTSWSFTDVGNNRVLSQDSTGNYIFPQLNYGFTRTINGQIVSIFNETKSDYSIYTKDAQVYFDNNYYDSNESFNLGSTKIATFVLIQGSYYVQISYSGA